jgi:hypothetical protein
MINNSIRNKGNTFPLEIKGLFYTRIISNFPQEMLGYVSNGNSVKHYIPRLRPNSKICSKRGETQ